jgi:alpha-glucosidase
MSGPRWWDGAVIYQVYPRSFQDSDGDGVGDLEGVRSRLGHLVDLGVDALWLSPIYPSPLADFGYDVSDYTAVDPVFGSLEDFDRLVADAYSRGLRVLMDLIPCHTSIEHPWFRDHPDWYIWTDRPNNWVAAFGGSAWGYHEERGSFYLHSFYPEQPDLDWRNPEVVQAMQGVIRFWLERGVDGYRIDAIDRLLKDPELRDDPPASEPFGLPLSEEEAKLALSNSRNAPDTGEALAAIREAAGDALLVGEVYLPSARWQPYLEHLDLVFAFELLHARWDAGELRRAIDAASSVKAPKDKGAAWVLSNHDFGRLPTRFGRENDLAATMLLLTLPGASFLYQGDEIGLGEGPGGDPPYDRSSRDRYRHPMQWDGSATGGFTAGRPWLLPVDPADRNVALQREDPGSHLAFVRALIELRRELPPRYELIDAAEGLIAYRRGEHVVVINTTDGPLPAPVHGEPVLGTRPGAAAEGRIAGHAGAILGAPG